LVDVNVRKLRENDLAQADLAFVDGMIARRDHFGARTYEHVEAKGVFHTEWEKE
jgi:6-phosphogluconate dehydrogenase